MKVAGIIAEYNPFHKGHLYQIEKTKEVLGENTFLVVVMSGNFMQRGEPAVFGKWTRAQSALACGADLVLELPFTFSCAPAERFAQGAVSTLSQLGIVTHLSFGSENNDLPLLEKISAAVHAPSLETENTLREHLKTGVSYAKAKELSIIEAFIKDGDTETAARVSTILSSPNAILALEYLHALKKTSITPLPILRKGAGYLDIAEKEGVLSATGIRHLMKKNPSVEGLAKTLAGTLPRPSAAALLADKKKDSPLVFLEDFAFEFVHSLSIHAENDIEKIAYMTDQLHGRLKNSIDGLRLFEEKTLSEVFFEKAYTRRFLTTRVNRSLISLLLGQTQEDIQGISDPSYARVLGFRKNGRYLLKKIKETCSLPVITKSSDFREHEKNPLLRRTAELDLLATELWNQKANIPFGDEFQRQVIMEKS